jgi:hypothetical protein
VQPADPDVSAAADAPTARGKKGKKQKARLAAGIVASLPTAASILHGIVASVRRR